MTIRETETPASAQRRHWALAVLCLLRERPMHPYEMRRLMHERHKDDRLVLKPGSLYNAVAWLERQRMIAAIGTEQVGRRPPRTTYRILPAGEAEVGRWIGTMLEALPRDTSSFAVALDQIEHLPAPDAANHLAARRQRLAGAIAALASTLEQLTPVIGRIHLLEVEHDLATYRAQDRWIQALLSDLESGRLHWNTAQLRPTADPKTRRPRHSPARRRPLP